MRYRLLGRTGLRVSELFLGAMTFGEQGGVGGGPGRECARILDVYAEAGGNVIDTAVNYRGGGERSASSASCSRGNGTGSCCPRSTPSRATAPTPTRRATTARTWPCPWRPVCGGLETDYIDLYWVHIWDRNTPLEETMRALDDAVRSGKVLYVGISDAPAWVVARANTLAECGVGPPLSALQVPYSLLNRDIERELLPMAEAFGMSVAAWSPLQNGILSGKYTRAGGPAPGTATRLSAETIGRRERAVAQGRAVRRGRARRHARAGRHRLDHGALPRRPPRPGRPPGRTAHGQPGRGPGWSLPEEVLARLEDTTGFRLGFPGDFIDEASAWVYGSAGQRVVPREWGRGAL